MRQYIGKVTLIGTRFIYKYDDVYEIEYTKNENTMIRKIENSFIQHVYKISKGKVLDVKKAIQLLNTSPKEISLPYEYGHKQQYYIQDILIVLVAIGCAIISKEGQKYIYTIVDCKNI